LPKQCVHDNIHYLFGSCASMDMGCLLVMDVLVTLRRHISHFHLYRCN